jgi:hypothetical protein
VDTPGTETRKRPSQTAKLHASGSNDIDDLSRSKRGRMIADSQDIDSST